MTLEETKAMTAEYIMATAKRLSVAWDKGDGVYLWDTEGHKYLDLLAGIAVNILGYQHPKMVDAMVQAASKPLHVTNIYHIPSQAQLAQQLVEASFPGKVFFCNSGTEANEAAVKLARKWGNESSGGSKNQIITTQRSFHGRTLAMIAATGQEKVRRGFDPQMPGFVSVEFGDIAALAAAINQDTCAIMLEPIQGEGGINLPPAGYLEQVRALCDEHNILLIFDEIQTGMGRTGKMFAYQHENIQPDILTLAKGLGSGVPVGAMIAQNGIAETFTPGSHGGTFGGNPFICSVASAVFQAIQDDDLITHSAEVGAYFLEALVKLTEKFSFLHNARGLGLMLAIDLDMPAGPVVEAGLKKGLILNAVQEKTLRFVPPLILQKQHVDEAIAGMTEIFEGLS